MRDGTPVETAAGIPAAAVVERVMELAPQWIGQQIQDDIAVVAISAPHRNHLSAVNGHTREGSPLELRESMPPRYPGGDVPPLGLVGINRFMMLSQKLSVAPTALADKKSSATDPQTHT